MTNTQAQQLFHESDYLMTNNPAVDLAISCIAYHKRFEKKLRKIYFRQDYYEMFRAYVSERTDMVDGQQMELDDVDIEISEMEIDSPMYLKIDE